MVQLFRKNRLCYLHQMHKGSTVKQFVTMLTLAVLMTGCTTFTLEPGDTPPQTEHEKLVKAQQEALAQQEQTTLNE